ncbi:histidine phosphatase family protein [Vallitalea pronyensis]|uniref:Histidine phosphatase family protein n=1 Tax=Vallitalea pronyensis TaxID=1348613 RepID=A0A8J8MM40_9FIRM|nr:histidine phosphatase family protein [Vallitalea pronyensis]QUI23783.1 histidine phosphatase family protein [Vallitalea pronyensis]
MNTEVTRLFITRHGETEWNLERRVQGSRDSKLTKKGIMQAKKLGKYLADTPIDIIYTSTSGRAVDTTKLITGKRSIDIVPMEQLQEMNMGIWEGLTFDEIGRKYEDMYDTFWQTPHLLKEHPGESFNSLKERVLGALLKIIQANEGKNILIVAHGIVLNVMMSYFEKRPLEKLFHEPHMLSTCLNEVEVQGDNHNIIHYAITDHYALDV